VKEDDDDDDDDGGFEVVPQKLSRSEDDFSDGLCLSVSHHSVYV